MGDDSTTTTLVEGVVSCSYNYSNFDDPVVAGDDVVVHPAINNTSGALGSRLEGEDANATNYVGQEVGDAKEADLQLGQHEFWDFGGTNEEQKTPAGEQENNNGVLLGCVVSSQQEIDAKFGELSREQAQGYLLRLKEEGREKEKVVVEAEGLAAGAAEDYPGSASAASGVNTSGESGERPRKGRPKGWTKNKATIGSVSEMQEPLKQEGGVALWVKWRGKWRACIQCYPNDCSTATARAMPTYSKKTYVVVFFPNSRTYSWVDLEYACHITESPEPLAFGTHQSGRDAVDNLDLPKHHMLRVLAANMLDISDRLPIKAVVESAQQVGAWKSFANEAVEAKEYSDISKMLVKLFGMIQQSCYNESWIQESFNRWKSDCDVADSAQAVENLNKELVNAILWDEVSTLWDAPEQSAVGLEWKDWKRAVIENRSIYPSISITPDTSLYLDSENLKRRRPEADLAAKRSKLDVRRRYPIPLTHAVKKEEPQALEVSGFSGDNQQVGKPEQFKTPPAQGFASTLSIVPKIDEDNLSGRSSSLSMPVSKRLLSNYQLCAAYMEKKKRQCTRFPSQGSLYCCKHMSLATGDGLEGVRKLEYTPQRPLSAPPKSSNTILPKMPGDKICEGMTKYGRRCTHRAKENSLFCKKHTFADAPHLNPDLAVAGSSQKLVEEKQEPSSSHQEDKEEPPQAEVKQQEVFETQAAAEDDIRSENSPRKRKLAPSIVEVGRSRNYSWHARRIGRIIKSNAGAAARVRCLGRCVNGDQCSHKSRPGSFYCEKHQPDNNAQQEEPIAEVKKHDDAQVLLKAKSWLSRYMESAKMEEVGSSEIANSSEKLLEWVLTEASKDLSAAETLIKLVNQRKERLGRFLKLQERAEATKVEGSLENEGKSTKHEEQAEQKQLDKIKCSICSEEFTEMVDLGSHWKSAHPTEAHWFLKGYACKECNKEFTNKSSLERHCKAEHEALTNIPALTVCINCDEKFPDFEALWDHVVTGHSDHLSAMPTISLPADDPTEDAKLVEDDGEDQYPVLSEDNKQDSPEDEDYMGIPTSDGESFEEMEGLDYIETRDFTDISEDNGEADCKYKCKLCGKKFKMLPDLGRHHQAEHMSAHVGTISKARTGGGASGAAREAVPGLHKNKRRGKVSKQGMNSILRIKKALYSVQQQRNERSGAETVAKLAGAPSEDDILAAATSACCETQMYNILEEKYESVPKGLLMTVLKLAIQKDQEIKWTREGYVCPQKCSSAPERLPEVRLHIYRKGIVAPSSRKKSVVLCEDISFGKECTPVPCVEDEETEPCTCPQCREGKSYHVDSLKPWETFSYVTRRLLDPSLGLDTKDSQVGCSCGRGRCTPKNCDHVDMFDSDYAEACDIWGEEMMGRFPYDGEGRIILQEGYLVYECNSSCMCSDDCPNRVLQRGVKVKLEVFKTRHKGWAVRAAQHIPRGTFVCEYLGEVLNDQEANKRGERYDQVGCSYLYDIDVHLNTGSSGRSRRGPSRAPRVKPFVIDATKHGNVARFINHSCSPNLVNYQVLVESMDYQLAHIGLYASRDILCGEELAYDYRYKLLPGRGCPCHCGASGCRGRLY